MYLATGMICDEPPILKARERPSFAGGLFSILLVEALVWVNSLCYAGPGG